MGNNRKKEFIMFKKLLIGVVIIIAGVFVLRMVNKPEVEITDEEAVLAYVTAMDGEGDYDIKIADNQTFGDEYIAYTVYKNGNLITFGEIERSYAKQFLE